jgi:hypothetical protein
LFPASQKIIFPLKSSATKGSIFLEDLFGLDEEVEELEVGAKALLLLLESFRQW